jgi:hypothetical protein
MTRKRYVRIFAVLLFFLTSALNASAQGDCYSYETDGVKLSGTISRKTFPGPPNYESVKRGDQPETYWVLHLARHICTAAGADNDAESNVTYLQLILTQKQYVLYKRFIARRARGVTVTGKLMHAITGHHHTPVLMEVTGMG